MDVNSICRDARSEYRDAATRWYRRPSPVILEQLPRTDASPGFDGESNLYTASTNSADCTIGIAYLVLNVN